MTAPTPTATTLLPRAHRWMPDWADCGQPRWPGWEWLIAALIAVQLALLAQAAGKDPWLLRPRPARVTRSAPTTWRKP